MGRGEVENLSAPLLFHQPRITLETDRGSPPMNFCSHCGARVVQAVPPGDQLVRGMCVACGRIHYENPKIVAGCIPEWGGRILLCKRAIEPRVDRWTFPAGFMELGESAEEAAVRETLEEADTHVTDLALHAVYSLTYVDQVYLVFRGILEKPEFAVTYESSEVDLFTLKEIPWQQLAFPVIREVLSQYVQDRRHGVLSVHVGTIIGETGATDEKTGPPD